MTHASDRNSSHHEHIARMTDEISLSEVFRQSLLFLRRHLWLILLLGFSFAVVTIVVTQKMERLYKSSVQLMIDPVATSPIEAETTTFIAADTGYVDGQILLIEADDTLLQVVKRGNLSEIPFFQASPPNIARRMISRVKTLILGPSSGDRTLPVGAPDRKSLVAKSILAKTLSVEREGDTNVISISVRANSPTLSQRTASLVAETYVDIRLSQRQQDARVFGDWINTRAEELRQQVSEAEAAVTEYRIENGLFNDEEGASLNDQQLTEINAELVRSRADLAQKRAALERARAVSDNGGDTLSLPEVQISEIITELRNQMLLLELRERDLSASIDQSNPRLIQVRQQYAAMSAQLDGEVRRIVDMLANEVQTLESRTALLTEALSLAGGQSTIETQSNVVLRQLERVAEAYLQHYQRYLDNAGLAAELRSFTTSGTQVVTSATVPIEPFYPTVKVFVILSFMLGSILAVIIGLAREALDTTFRSAQQVETLLGTRLRAQIPKLRSGQDIPEIVRQEPLGQFSETISVLRYMLLSARSEDGRAPVFLLTSNGAGEGKTSIASSLALSASIAGQNVLLIDADMRRAGLTRNYGMDGDIGFAEILQGTPWQPLDTQETGLLDILPAGILVDMPLNALASPNLPKFLDLARRSYDLIVIDGPPVAHIADCTILSRYCDQLLFVVRWGQTKRDQAVRGFQCLPKSKISGVVMNCCPPNDEIGLGSTYKLYSRAMRKPDKIVSLDERRLTDTRSGTGAGGRRA
jgi:succinoglycan biosynthesis transport protein ExoP